MLNAIYVAWAEKHWRDFEVEGIAVKRSFKNLELVWKFISDETLLTSIFILLIDNSKFLDNFSFSKM